MSYRRENEIGRRKDPNDVSAFAYGNTVEGPGGPYGIEGGFGINTGMQGSKEGWHGGSGLLQGNGFLGARTDDDGTAWHGAGGHVSVAELFGGYGDNTNGWHVNGNAQAFGADAEASLNPDKGAQLGAGAYIVQGAVEGGHLSKETGHDLTGRFGMGAGVGAAGRLHWADEDGDGIREIGLGADIGPFSFDVKSETLGQGYNWLEQNVPAAWDASTDWVGNAWDTSTDWVGNAWDGTTDAVSDGWGAATDWASNTWTGATDAVSSGWNSATDAVASGWGSATDAVSSGWGAATDAVSSGWGSATDAVSSGWNSATDAVGDFFSGW